VSLSVENLTIARGRRRIVEDVSFSLARGEILVVVGANGAGKTTLLDGILGFLPLRAGRVRFGEATLDSLPARARVLSCMPDEAEPPAEVEVSTLLAHARRFGAPPAELPATLETRLGLAKLRGARAGELSRGEKRRLQLYAALCTARPVVVLDEPLGTFDPLQLIGVLDLLRERAAAGTSLLLSVHQMSDAEKIASRVLILHEGRVLALGTLDELRARANVGGSLESVFLALLESHAAA
jgi:ABC-type multidrug transport system ATPase subunit